MSRAARLLDLLQILRQHRQPVSGTTLAAALGVSVRTVYRDIQSLIAQGADIQGEAGVGFVLRPGFLLPPLMFPEAEIDALVLGARWVMRRGDPAMAAAAAAALARIGAVLPERRRDGLEDAGLLAGPGPPLVVGTLDLAVVRDAMRAETKLQISYADAGGTATDRLIWPLALAFFDHVRVIVAWCELRQDFRHFRTDRVRTTTGTTARFAKPRRTLLRLWREQLGASDRADEPSTPVRDAGPGIR